MNYCYKILLACLVFVCTTCPAAERYQPTFWLIGGHLQTIVPFLLSSTPDIAYHREHWELDDGDFIDADWVNTTSKNAIENTDTTSTIPPVSLDETRPIVIMFHGLEGNSHSSYAEALMNEVVQRGWIGVVFHFRGCSGIPNRLPRVYYAGDTDEIERMIQHVKLMAPQAPLYAVGYSLGGNALLKWLGEDASEAKNMIQSAAAISAPIDLAASSNALASGLDRILYGPTFVSSMRTKALNFAKRFPGLLDVEKIENAETIKDIDGAITAVLYGAKDADDYYAQNASKPWLPFIQVPVLVINAKNDPFVPADSLPRSEEVSAQVKLEYLSDGGHVGFAESLWPSDISWLPRHILDFFTHLSVQP